MVAYSFKEQFFDPILYGVKRQTIRADRKRHVRPYELMQLYTAMRTKYCRPIGTAVCLSVRPITMLLGRHDPRVIITHEDGGLTTLLRSALDEFAEMDGFRDWPEMMAFWEANHAGVHEFTGVLIRWTGFREGVHRV